MEIENYISHVPRELYTDTLRNLDLICECIYFIIYRHIYVSQIEKWRIFHALYMLIYKLYNYIIWISFVFALQISGNLIPRAAE